MTFPKCVLHPTKCVHIYMCNTRLLRLKPEAMLLLVRGLGKETWHHVTRMGVTSGTMEMVQFLSIARIRDCCTGMSFELDVRYFHWEYFGATIQDKNLCRNDSNFRGSSGGGYFDPIQLLLVTKIKTEKIRRKCAKIISTDFLAWVAFNVVSTWFEDGKAEHFLQLRGWPSPLIRKFIPTRPYPPSQSVFTVPTLHLQCTRKISTK